MNAHFTRKPTAKEIAMAGVVSDKARQLVGEYGREVGDSHEWPNQDNVTNTKIALLAYIAELEHKK